MKLLIVFALGFLASWNLKGNMILTADNQVQLGFVTIPVPEFVQNSPAYGVLTMIMGGQQPRARSATFLRAAPAPVAAAIPMVTSASTSYSANAPAAGPANPADPFGAATKALRGQ